MFPYLEFSDKYLYAKDYDMLAKYIADCSILNNYFLYRPSKTYMICNDCECFWICHKLFCEVIKNGE